MFLDPVPFPSARRTLRPALALAACALLAACSSSETSDKEAKTANAETKPAAAVTTPVTSKAAPATSATAAKTSAATATTNAGTTSTAAAKPSTPPQPAPPAQPTSPSQPAAPAKPAAPAPPAQPAAPAAASGTAASAPAAPATNTTTSNATAAKAPQENTMPQTAEKKALTDIQVKTLEGQPANLADYKGKVLLVVNTASECGFTPQYEGLEKLYEQYQGKGLVVLGFPSNDFGGQEPGDSKQIRDFCTSKFSVKFPMFNKVQTKEGPDQSPVYGYLGKATGNLPNWNFCKYLVGKDGKAIAFYPSKVTPEDSKLRADIDKALGS